MPFFIIRLLIKSIKEFDYCKNILSRFYYRDKREVDYMLHAVSLGESVAATPLINTLLCNDSSILITNHTPAGYNYVTNKYQKNDNCFNTYLPFDFLPIMYIFLKRVNPKKIILLESEFWPNLLLVASWLRIPVYSVNSRLSPRSYSRLRLFPIYKSLLGFVAQFATQSLQDYKRFLKLGIPKNRLNNVGNLKYIVEPNKINLKKGSDVKKLFREKKIVSFISIHTGEIEIIVKEISKLLNSIPNLFFILVPRHKKNFMTVAKALSAYKITFGLKTDGIDSFINKQCLLGNTFGEIDFYNGMSDCSIMCGSFINGIGGHNVLEPIAANIPTITGPYNANNSDLVNNLVKSKSLIRLDSIYDLEGYVLRIFNNNEFLEELTANGSKSIKENSESLLKTLAIINN